MEDKRGVSLMIQIASQGRNVTLSEKGMVYVLAREGSEQDILQSIRIYRFVYTPMDDLFSTLLIQRSGSAD
jgi:hypothetical protein